MIQPNGQNGNGSAAMIEEPAAHEAVIAVPTAVQEQEPELATRTSSVPNSSFSKIGLSSSELARLFSLC